ncbi:SOS response-associated peptidase [Thiobacillus sedimenti]|uniref:Abasic site processing protein n=1 Tax=Thiobacillus sedimenti TaxID=3110231 RepID=A0ABZ1CMP9_9PROT|nr:SOS response-associated peptidase [Thiobacillus sp. SCUT-2]WRS40665.1 SOS response-associated peptidase [Thiobacillus sp. SCUT-2]
MCGRYALTSSPAVIAERFRLLWTPDFPPHYNIAPSQTVPIVRETEAGRALAFVRWGLIPSWAKDASIGMKLINARGESLGDKPAFRSAYRRRHCLVPADAFYEWKPIAGRKQPFCVRLRDDGPFGMAGLWEHWTAPDGDVVESCTIVTVEATGPVADLHDRMPLIVAPADYDAWLSAGSTELPAAVPPEALRAYPVSPLVSNARNDVPACLEPIELG